VEGFLADIEGRAGLVLDKLRRDDFSLTRRQREEFANFFAAMLTRVPHDRNEVKENAKRMFSQFKGLYPTRFQERMSEFTSTYEVKEAEVEDKLADVYSLVKMVRDMPMLTGMLVTMRWSFYRTNSKNGFLTSDRPAIFLPPDGRNPMGSVSFPLTPNLYLIAKPVKNLLRVLPTFLECPSPEELIAGFIEKNQINVARVSHADEAQIIKANSTRVQHADRYVFSPRTNPKLERFVSRIFNE
jgi:hypothetical protein